MKIGLISDGKYGERAFANIEEKFEVEWILVPDIPPTNMLDDDIELDIPECDLYLSYVLHPDIILELAELQKPLILGVLPGLGLYKQAKEVNPNVVHVKTMCSLLPNTGIPEVDEFATYFGNPIFEINLTEKNIISDISIKRVSPCGSTSAGPDFMKGKQINTDNMQQFALAICHHCRAPRFGHTCDKETSGCIHMICLVKAAEKSDKFKPDEDLLNLINGAREHIQNVK